MLDNNKKQEDVPSIDPIRELIFLCYNGNFPTLLMLLLGQPHLLLQPVRDGIGDCPKVEHEELWEKLQATLLNRASCFTVGDLLLCVGCMLKNEKLVEFLSQRGVDINHGANTDDLLSALYIACKNQHIALVKFLISKKAEIKSLTVKEYPDMICQVLENYVEKYKVIKENKRKKKPSRNTFKLCWENLHLHALHTSWFAVHKYELTRVELSRNKLTKMNDDFFTQMVHLEELDVSSNSLTCIPIVSLASSNLKRLNVSSNQLSELPEALFNNTKVLVIDVSRNKLTALPNTNKQWKCSSLEKFDCSNNLLSDLPPAINGASRLKVLDLSRNKFVNFNKSWKCQLEELNLSYNELEEVSCKHDGFKSLRTLNLTHNRLSLIPSTILHFAKLETLKLGKNRLQSLPRPDTWKNKRLSDLDLSFNQLSTTPIPDGFLDIETEKMEYNHTCELPVKLFADTLQSLNISNNLIDQVPETLCQLVSLGYLDLSNNPNLTHLPPKLGLLKNIWNLNLSGLEIENIAYKLDGMNHVKVLSLLRAKLRRSVPFNRVKLMVVGLQGRGKTTLVSAIQGIPNPPNISTVGISIQQFVLPLKDQYLSYLFPNSPQDEIVFSVWDLAGQQIYYATHQCFLTGKALYLVVYNVTHGSEGIESLVPWLLNIQARAPESRCIIVGTHVDKMPYFRKTETLDKYRSDILNKFQRPGFPLISGCFFVSGKTGENIEELRQVIHEDAFKMNQESEMGKIAPISYLELYDSVTQQSQACKELHQAPALTTEEMLQLAALNPNNDIVDFEELCTAAKFLQENGVMLHFNDHLRGLNNIFFIDPSWLVDMLALVVAVPQRNPHVQNGYINKDELLAILQKEPSLPEEIIPQYLRLLERFEVLLSLEDGKFLIPCMLPSEKPDIDDKLYHVVTPQDIKENRVESERSTFCLTRDYHMEYIPAGLWARLIARFVIAVEKWSCQVQQGEQTKSSYAKYLWRDGLLITYEDGYFLVEAFHDEELRPKRWSNKGVAITVWSLEQDFSVMGFIVDHLDMLITEWYPGLGDLNHAGDKLVQKLIPCPVCSAQKAIEIMKCCENHVLNLRTYYSSFFRNEFFVNQFPLDTCACAVISHDSIICVNHPKQAVMLKSLIPEIMMTDLPHKFSIQKDDFDFDPDTSEKIGDGGAGIVYLGYLGDVKVAIKRSRSAIMKQNQSSERVFDPSSHSLTRLLEQDDGTVVKAFWEMRQEVLVLCTLQHPNIIEFIGVCFSPLCFVIEFAPMGSLYGIIEKRKEEGKTIPVLGSGMTYLILFQIAEALKYLHSWNIIYRDLKSENVLVMDLDEENSVNVKLSDYGIAAFATPQGVTGEAGTPAFQAPEVQRNCTYDEKVDVYSYGIWMYEIVSGSLPFLEYRSGSEIIKAVRSGVRPSFQRDGVECSHPYTELIMKSCWQRNPPSRPSFVQISSSFMFNDILSLHRVYPSRHEAIFLEHITCQSVWNTNFPDSDLKGATDKMLLWNNKKEDRTFILFDLNSQQIRWKDSLPGPRVSCACQVEENVWLGCETRNCIEVFGYHGKAFPTIKCTFPKLDDEILMILKYQNEELLIVFASLANGTLVFFTKMAHHHETESINYEDLWSRQIINLETGGKPAKCMVITRQQKELWVGSGNQIVVVDILSRKVVERLTTVEQNKDQSTLLSSMCTDGEQKVWTSLWKLDLVTEWDIQSRAKTYEYYCSEKNVLGAAVRYRSGTFPCLIRQPSLVEVPEVKKVKEKKEEFLANNRVVVESLYKRPSLRFPTRVYIRSKSSASSTSSLYDSNHFTGIRKSTPRRTVTSIRYAGNILWVGRTSGDILAIDYVTGHVVTVLGTDELKLLGDENRYVQSMVLMATNKLAACIRSQPLKGKRKSLIPTKCLDERQKESFQILVYDLWSRDQLLGFNERSREIFNDQL